MTPCRLRPSRSTAAPCRSRGRCSSGEMARRGLTIARDGRQMLSEHRASASCRTSRLTSVRLLVEHRDEAGRSDPRRASSRRRSTACAMRSGRRARSTSCRSIAARTRRPARGATEPPGSACQAVLCRTAEQRPSARAIRADEAAVLWLDLLAGEHPLDHREAGRRDRAPRSCGIRGRRRAPIGHPALAACRASPRHRRGSRIAHAGRRAATGNA